MGILSALLPSIFPDVEQVAGLARLAEAGKQAVLRAEADWLVDVTDPPAKTSRLWTQAQQASAALIDRMIRTKRGLGWSWLKAYAGNPLFQWCGAAVASWWADSIAPEVFFTFWASTERLCAWAQYLPFNDVPNPEPKRGLRRVHHRVAADAKELPSGYAPQLGDILIVGDGKLAVGNHITISRGYDAARRMFLTYEGNAVGGVGPHGDRREGIIKAERPLGQRTDHDFHVMRIIRPAPHDLLTIRVVGA